MKTMTSPGGRTDPGIHIDPRIRERRIEVQREQGRRRLRVVVWLAALTAVAVGGLWVLHSSLLGVRRVAVVGQSELSEPALLAAAGIRVNEPLIDVSPARVERRLEAVAWVATARVERRWPASLRIALTVRHPVGQMSRGGGGRGPVALVDSSGRVVADSPSAVPGLPLLVGAGPVVPLGHWLVGSPGPGRSGVTAGGTSRDGASAPRSAAALALAAELDADHLSATKVAVGADGTASVVIAGGATVVDFGSASDLGAKVRVLRVLSIDGDLRGAAVVDLAVPERPTVTPGGSGRATASGGSSSGSSSGSAAATGTTGNGKG